MEGKLEEKGLHLQPQKLAGLDEKKSKFAGER